MHKHGIHIRLERVAGGGNDTTPAKACQHLAVHSGLVNMETDTIEGRLSAALNGMVSIVNGM